MTHFVWPFVFLLLPLPVLVRMLLPRVNEKNEEALKVPFFENVEVLSKGSRFKSISGLKMRRFFGVMIWILLLLAAARPQWVGEPAKIPSEGRNLMVVLDVSGSMEEPDFALNGRKVRRWDAVKAVANEFVKKREGDRVGVILFGERAYVYAPLTFDLKTVSDLLDEADVGMAGTQTAIGDALGLALKTMIDVPAQSKVVVLLSDGAANAGKMRPLEAGELAKKMGVKVYTVGAASETVAVQGLFGVTHLPRGDEIDEKTLEQISKMTGGRYFRAKNTRELMQIYNEIDALEPVKNDDIFIRPLKELFYYPLAGAFALSIFGVLLFLAGRSIR